MREYEVSWSVAAVFRCCVTVPKPCIIRRPRWLMLLICVLFYASPYSEENSKYITFIPTRVPPRHIYYESYRRIQHNQGYDIETNFELVVMD
jgi:hypothetical protein